MVSEDAVMIGLNHIYLRDPNLSPFITLILTLGRLVMVSLRVPCWVLCCSWFISMIFIWQLNIQKLFILLTIHILHFAKTISSLCSKINADLRILTCWLNANKISLNSSKTEFILFDLDPNLLISPPFLSFLVREYIQTQVSSTSVLASINI